RRTALTGLVDAARPDRWRARRSLAALVAGLLADAPQYQQGRDSLLALFTQWGRVAEAVLQLDRHHRLAREALPAAAASGALAGGQPVSEAPDQPPVLQEIHSPVAPARIPDPLALPQRVLVALQPGLDCVPLVSLLAEPFHVHSLRPALHDPLGPLEHDLPAVGPGGVGVVHQVDGLPLHGLDQRDVHVA